MSDREQYRQFGEIEHSHKAQIAELGRHHRVSEPYIQGYMRSQLPGKPQRQEPALASHTALKASVGTAGGTLEVALSTSLTRLEKIG